MDPLVLALVLAAAVLHASWNALVKSGGDPWVRMALTNVASALCAAAVLPFVPFPNAQAWPFILASVTIHQVYFACVCLQYRFGDLSHVYPLSRGVAPLMVAACAFVFAGETLSPGGIAAVVVISGAILSLAFGPEWRGENRLAVLFALATGTTIAAYTLIDGIGGRSADEVLSYIVYLFVIEWVPFAALVAVMRRGALRPTIAKHWKTGALGGVLSFLAYALVIWAMTLTPMTYVSALRETSVILAALIGTRLMKEPFGAKRLTAAACVAAGVVLLQLSNGS